VPRTSKGFFTAACAAFGLSEEDLPFGDTEDLYLDMMQAKDRG